MSVRRGMCVHFNGRGLPGTPDRETCAAGVDFDAKFGPDFGIMLRCPCIQERRGHERIDGKMVPVWKPVDRREHVEVACDKRLMPTEEQIAAADAEDQRSLSRVIAGLKVAGEWRTKKRPFTNRHAVVECPECKGRLHLSQAASNGHVQGQCETPRCLSWME